MILVVFDQENAHSLKAADDVTVPLGVSVPEHGT